LNRKQSFHFGRKKVLKCTFQPAVNKTHKTERACCVLEHIGSMIYLISLQNKRLSRIRLLIMFLYSTWFTESVVCRFKLVNIFYFTSISFGCFFGSLKEVHSSPLSIQWESTWSDLEYVYDMTCCHIVLARY
jgi:hypothetical protein